MYHAPYVLYGVEYIDPVPPDVSQANLHEKTHSVWSYLYSRHEDFLNPLYVQSQRT